MDILRRYYMPFIFFIVIIEATGNDFNETSSSEDRQSRATGRIVKLYSGPKPEPILCAGEGFQKDPYNCAVFYRCMKSGNGKYTVFRFQCGPGTVYDPDTEVCNHPRSTKRSECGGVLAHPTEDTTHINEIESMHNEIPSPIITNRPIYITSSSSIKTTSTTTARLPSSSDLTHLTTKRDVTTSSISPYPWGTSISNVYIDNAVTAYPVKSTTTRPFISTHGTFTPSPSTTSHIPNTNLRDNICTTDGFMGDTENCRKFYRCVANQRGGYTRYEFSCTENTIWDDDNQVCNHVWAVKRSRCGHRIDKIMSPNIVSTTEKLHYLENNIKQNVAVNKSNITIQQQLQISSGSKVTQTQTQISNGPVIQNQTQIHYGDRIQPTKNNKSHQNQNQISHGSAVSQAQTQINYGNNGVQTQLQIDHSNKASQTQVQINESSTKQTSTSPEHVDKEITNTQNNNVCTKSGFMGDSNNCQKFYRCIENGRGGYTKYEFSCSEGTVWDQSIEACNHAWAVKECGSKTSGKPPATTATTVTTSTSKTIFSQHTTTSTETYQIIPEPEVIEDNENNGYAKPIPTSPSSSTTVPALPIDNSNKGSECISSGFMGDDNDCKIFYRCVENGNGGYIRHQFKCGEGTVWDPEIAACNHAWAVKKCGGSTSPDITKIETTTKKPTTAALVHQSSTITTESTTKNYDDYYNGYQKPQEKPAPSSTSTTVTPIPVDSSKDGECTSSGFMGDNNDCKIFYRCVENGNGGYVKHQFKCGEGTVWDPEIGACNHAWAVKKCGGTLFSNTTEVETTTKKLTTSYHSTTSTENYQIITDIIDTAHDEEVGYQKPEQMPTLPATSTTSTTINGSNGKECTSSGFMGDDNDCKIFYRCVENGSGGYVKYEFKCGEGTVWDPEIEACNHAWAVKECGGSVSHDISETETTTKKLTMSPIAVSSTMITQSTTQIAPNTDYDDNNDSGYGPSHHDISTTKQPQGVNQNKIVCKSSGFVGDNYNCKKFYRCVDNGEGGYITYEFTCSEGTVWDPKIDACNHEWAVEKCGGSSTTTGVEETVGSSTEFTNIIFISTSPTTTTNINDPTSTNSEDCTQSGYMGDSKNCNKFYRCVDKGDGSFIKFEYTCGEGTLWDQDIEACNHAWAVTTCGSSVVSPNEEHGTTSSYHPTINDEIDNGYPSNANPDADNIPDKTTSTTDAPKESGQSSVCIKIGFIGDKNNCKKFYRCVDNGNGGFIKYEFNCGEGTVWDQSIEACNHAWAVKECGSATNNSTEIPNAGTTSTTVTMVTSISQEYPKVTEGYIEKETDKVCSEEGFIGDSNNCKIFYRCVDDGKGGFTKFEFTCGTGTYWNQENLSCDHVTSDNECGEKGSTTTSKVPQYEHDDMYTETTTTSKDDIYSSQKPSVVSGVCTSEGFYGEQNDCKKFFRCVDNGQGGYTKYDFTCGDGTAWDQELQTCNHESSKCSTTSSSSTQTTAGHSQHGDGITLHTSTEKSDSSSSTSSSTTSESKCESDGFFADPNDCRKFIRCVKNDKDGFTRYQFTCAEGTVWVQEMLSCDHDTGETPCRPHSATKPAQSEHHQQTTEKYEQSTTNNVLGDEQDNKYNNTNTSSGNDICSSEGFYGNKNDCRKFYRCVDNGNGGYRKYDFTCSEGTAWDVDIQACNHIDQVPSCHETVLHDEYNTPTTQDTITSSQDSTTASSTTQKSTDTSKPSSESTTQNSQKTDTCESEGYFGNTQDCKKFYRCVDNGNGGYTKYDFTCAEGTIWDQDITTCNHPGDVANPSCNSTNDSSMTGDSSIDNSSSNGSSTVTTENTSQTQSQDETSKKPDNSNVNCTEAGFYPNPNDCKKFYRCVDWDGDGTKFSVFHFECGEGTIWDPAVETCNHEESVYPPRNCSGSQSQSQPSTTESTTTTTEETASETTTIKNTEQSPTTTESTTSTTTEQSEENTTISPQENTTQQSTESTTEKQGESTTEKSDEGTTEKANESTTQQSTEGTTENPSQSTTEKQEESTTEQSGATTEKTEQSTTEKGSDSTTEPSGEVTTEKSSEGTTEQNGVSTTEQSTEKTTEKTGESTTEQSTEKATEQTGESTTEQSTEKTTEQTGESTTEQTEGTTQKGSNNESSTTESSATEQITTEETSTEKSTTEQSTSDQGSTTESGTESTNENSGDKECPETEEDQYLFVCPSSFRRHPKYCNLFYQCDENEETHDLKIATFTCPNGTIYDESKTKCVEESKADKPCDGEIAQKLRVKRRNRKEEHEPIVVSKDSYACSSAGYYAFEKDGDCSPGFLKCTRNKSNKLRGFVYQCPEGYIFWSVSRRCERIDRVRDCRRSTLNNWTKRWEIPVEIRNVAWA